MTICDGCYPMEKIENLHVREVGEALKGLGRERLNESDASFLIAPEIVEWLKAAGFHEANGTNLLDHCDTSWQLFGVCFCPVNSASFFCSVIHSSEDRFGAV